MHFSTRLEFLRSETTSLEKLRAGSIGHSTDFVCEGLAWDGIARKAHLQARGLRSHLHVQPEGTSTQRLYFRGPKDSLHTFPRAPSSHLTNQGQNHLPTTDHDLLPHPEASGHFCGNNFPGLSQGEDTGRQASAWASHPLQVSARAACPELRKCVC